MPANTPRGYTYPLYGDTQNFPAQIQDLAQDIDLDVEALDNAIQAGYNRASARISGPPGGTLVTTSGTGVNLTFDVEEYDNAAMANLGVNNDRLTVTVEGFYLVTIHATYSTGPSATWGAFLAWNTTGTTVGQPIARTTQGHNTLPTNLTVTSIVFAPVGATFTGRVLQQSGANINVIDCSMTATLMS